MEPSRNSCVKFVLLLDEQPQSVFFRQLHRLNGGHRLADEGGNTTGADGLAHHIHRHPAAGVKDALPQRHSVRQCAADGFVERIVAAQILALVRGCGPPAAENSCARRGWRGRAAVPRPWLRPASRPRPPAHPAAAPGPAGGVPPERPRSGCRCSSSAPPARRRRPRPAGGSGGR